MAKFPLWIDILNEESDVTEARKPRKSKAIAKRDKIAKGIMKNASDMKKRYGKQAKNVAYATANKMTMKESDNIDEVMHTAIGDMTCEACGAPMDKKIYEEHDGLCETCGEYSLDEVTTFNSGVFDTVNRGLMPKVKDPALRVKIAAGAALTNNTSIAEKTLPLPPGTESRPIREHRELFPLRMKAATTISKLLGESTIPSGSTPEQIVNAGMVKFVSTPHTLQEWQQAASALVYARKMKIQYDSSIFNVRRIKH